MSGDEDLVTETEGFVVTSPPNGLHVVRCKRCARERRAVGGADAIKAVQDEHRCGSNQWHLPG